MNVELEALIEELQVFCARYNLHWAMCADPETGKIGVLIAHAKSVPYMKYMEMTGIVDPVPPKELH